MSTIYPATPQPRLKRGLLFFLLLFAALLILTHPPTILAAGTITGTVYRDFNGNGEINTTGTSPNYAIDKHMAGVTVTAYDAAGTIQGTTTTVYCNASGGPPSYCTGNGTGPNYSLGVSGAGPYRLEFTWDSTSGWPANPLYGYQSGPVGTGSKSSVQFVDDPSAHGGTIANVNFGVLQPADYSQNQPKMAVPLQAPGNRLLSSPSQSALVSFNYGENGTLTTLRQNQYIGSTWGLAYDRLNNTLYVAAVLKRHSDFGPDGSGAIYAVNPDNGTQTTFVNLNTLGGGIDTGQTLTPAVRNLTTTPGGADADSDAFPLVGKYSLGDIDISDDGSTLYIVNLFQRKLIALTIATKTVAAQYDLTVVPSGATACPTDDLRPFGIKVYRDQVYVGVVCSAESTPAVPGNMRGYVWRLNGSAFESVLDFPLNFVRVRPGNDATRATNWHPWASVGSPTTPVIFGANYFDKYSQPTIADIEFDDRDNMFIGFLDRWGNQTGELQIPPNGVNVDEAGASAGDILLACRSGVGWILENGPSSSTCPGYPLDGFDPSKAGGGPNLGEFIYAEGGNENESSIGALAVLHGTGKITLTTGDPIVGNSGGVAYLTAPVGPTPVLAFPDGQVNPTGVGTTAVDVGRFTVYTYQDHRWGKGTGMGDIELISLAAPLEIGNRVWKDTNGNGRQDPGEDPIPGVTVELRLASDNSLVSSAVTDSSGNFKFSATRNTGYNVIVPNAEGTGKQSALTTAGVQYISIPFNGGTPNGIIRDSNGIKTPVGGGAYNSAAAVTTGGPGTNNHTIDFGFNNVGPTAVMLSTFNGRVNKAGKVALRWQTGSELTVLGFNVWRSTEKKGIYRKVNPQLVPAAGIGQLTGAKYKYRDLTVRRGKKYFYKIEIVTTSGPSEWSPRTKLKIPK